MATNNVINDKAAGLVRYDGTSTFDAVTTTNHNLLIGAASNGITNVAPSATSGVPVISQGASADPAFGTAVVAGGGTGGVSFTAFSVLCAGTSSTSPFQNVSGLGSSGQVLTSNGAGNLPTWQAGTTGSSIQTAMVNLTSAQIKALVATPIQIVATPGAGNIIFILQTASKFNYGGTNVFTNGQTISVRYDNSGTYSIAASSAMSASDIVSTLSGYYSYNNGTFSGSITAATNMDNRRIVIVNTSGSEITGNAANDNTLTVFVSYIIVPILT